MDPSSDEREAVASIRPLKLFSDGPNYWTTDVPGWSISAPTKDDLTALVRDWFANGVNDDRP